MFITSSIGAMFAGASVVHHYYKPNLVSAVPLSVLVTIFDAYYERSKLVQMTPRICLLSL